MRKFLTGAAFVALFILVSAGLSLFGTITTGRAECQKIGDYRHVEYSFTLKDGCQIHEPSGWVKGW